ncbi:YfhE family protein [Bacillus marinisedimentorum]|uniref:YfhE family protein n=1 Tax=Bacillus marinisedimentorum TaxID=1821260 RepID=UPI0009F66525|nr:YfhE family protein [Bacillus marinisedimentorum]
MARNNAQYQPTDEKGFSLSDAQEVKYSHEFKKADIAGGIRKPKVRRAKRENPDLLRDE